MRIKRLAGVQIIHDYWGIPLLGRTKEGEKLETGGWTGSSAARSGGGVGCSGIGQYLGDWAIRGGLTT